jgi:hypothetical protein
MPKTTILCRIPLPIVIPMAQLALGIKLYHILNFCCLPEFYGDILKLSFVLMYKKLSDSWLMVHVTS